MNTPDERRIACEDIRMDFGYDTRGKVDQRDCPLCHHAVSIQIAHTDRYGFAATFELCQQCGFVYVAPRLDEDSYTAFYQGYYRDLVAAYWDCVMSQANIQADSEVYARDLWSWLEPFCSERRSHRLLDIGGSTGVICRLIADKLMAGGCTIESATVVDPCVEELKAAERMGLHGVASLVEKADLEGHFTLLLICRTMDHVTSPKDLLTTARRLLTNHKEPGLLYVDIVDWEYIFQTEGISESLHIDHPSNFTYQNFSVALAVAGLDVVAESVRPGGIEIGFLCRPGRPSWKGRKEIAWEAERLFSQYRDCEAREAREAGRHPLRPHLGRKGIR